MNDTTPQTPPQSTVQRILSRPTEQWSRLVIGGLGVLALGYKYMAAQNDEDAAFAGEASAVQFIQVYTPHIFDAMVIIGVMIGLYIVTRGLSD